MDERFPVDMPPGEGDRPPPRDTDEPSPGQTPDAPLFGQVVDADMVDAELVAEPPLAVWPAFAIVLGALAACTVSQIPVIIAMMAYQVAVTGGRPNVERLMETPLQFVAIALPAQLALLGVWWLATSLGDPRVRAFRAIGSTTLGLGAYLCFLPASFAMLLLGDPLSEWGRAHFGEWSADSFVKMYEGIDWASGLLLVAFISIAPAIAEELLFRGYVQRRLLARWRPAAAIPTVAVMFAAFHGTPVWALAVLPVGFWFGILAWRTGSLWPGMCCHAFVNGSVNLWRVGAQQGVWPAQLSPAVSYALMIVCALSLLVAVWILVTYPRRAQTAATTVVQAA